MSTVYHVRCALYWYDEFDDTQKAFFDYEVHGAKEDSEAKSWAIDAARDIQRNSLDYFDSGAILVKDSCGKVFFSNEICSDVPFSRHPRRIESGKLLPLADW